MRNRRKQLLVLYESNSKFTCTLLRMYCSRVHSLPCRQCALVALQDVKAYLTGEGGQIAVSPLCLSVHLGSKNLKYTTEQKHIWNKS